MGSGKGSKQVALGQSYPATLQESQNALQRCVSESLPKRGQKPHWLPARLPQTSWVLKERGNKIEF